jgi:LytS/YehU family sensor histidine kinase
MPSIALGSMNTLVVVIGPMARTLCLIPAGIHTHCAGGTTQAPCSVDTIITPTAPYRS